MEQIILEKLVRDRLPEIIIAEGDAVLSRILHLEEVPRKLLEKVFEEAGEALEVIGDQKKLAEKLGDVWEVLETFNKRLESRYPKRIKAKRSYRGFQNKNDLPNDLEGLLQEINRSVMHAREDPDNSDKVFADVMRCIMCMCKIDVVTGLARQIGLAKSKKLAERGGFERGVFLYRITINT